MIASQSSSPSPSVSVVVPTRNRADRLGDVLDPLLADPATSELIVVDDGSSDATPDALAALSAREPRLRVLRLGGVGAAAARQRGVEAATGTIVLFVDDDVVAAPGLVSGHRDRHANAGREVVVIGYMPVRRPSPRRPGDAPVLIYERDYEACCAGWERAPASILNRFWAGNVSLRRDRCLVVPLPSPHAPIAYLEDEDFGLRLRDAGVPAVFDRSLRAEHRYRRSMAGFLLDAYRQGADRWHLHVAYPDLAETLSWSLEPRPVPLAEHRVARLLLLRLAVAATHVAGRLHLWRIERDAFRLARRLEQRRGWTDAAAGVRSVASR